MKSTRFAQPGGALPGEPVLDQKFCDSASMKVMTDTATGRRTPSGVMTAAMPCSLQAARSTLS